MLKSEDKLVVKTILKKELVTKDELEKCLDVYKEESDEVLIDFLISQGYLSKFQGSDLQKELEKKLKILVQGEMLQCDNCQHFFNSGLLKSERRLRCGVCGVILSQVPNRSAMKKNNAEVVYPVQNSQINDIEEMEEIEEIENIDSIINIPGYIVKRLLGKNFYGTTFKAEKDNELYAIHVLNERFIKDKKYMSKLVETIKKYQEAAIPSTPICHGLHFHEKTPYILWEYIEGDSVFKILRKKKPISEEEAIKLMVRIVKILRLANDQGFVHHSLCPSNIIFAKKNNKPALLNFGIHQKILDSTLFMVEQHGEIPFFLAPEHVGPQKNFDFRTDMYTLGLIFYNIITEKPLFSGTSPYEIIKSGNNITLEKLLSISPEADENILAIIHKMLAPLPNNRYQSYKELLWHLQSPERVHRNISLTEIGEEIFEQPTEMISHSKKLEAIQDADAVHHKMIEKKDLETRLRKRKSKMRKQKQPNTMRNIIIILAILGIGFYFVYDNIQKNQRSKIAANAYKTLKSTFNKNLDSSSKWPQLKKDLEKYTNDYKEQEFYVENVYSDLNEMNNKWKLYLYNETNKVRDQVNNLIAKEYFALCLQEMDKIPSNLVDNAPSSTAKDISGKLKILKENIMFAADKSYNELEFLKNTLFVKCDNQSGDYSPSFLKREYEDIKRKMDIKTKRYSKNVEHPHEDIQAIINNINVDKKKFQKRFQKYLQSIEELSEKELEEKIKNIDNNILMERKNWNFSNALKLCKKQKGKVSKGNEIVLEQISERLILLINAKAYIVKEFKNSSDNIKTFHNKESHTLINVSLKDFFLNRKVKLKWSNSPKFLISKLITKASKIGDVPAETLLALSFLAKEAKDEFLFYNLLSSSVRSGSEKARNYQDKLDIYIESKISDGLSKIKNKKLNKNARLGKLLRIKNMIPAALKQQYDPELDKIFQNNMASKSAKFYNFNNSKQVKNWKLKNAKFPNGVLQTSKTIEIPIKNINVISGFFLFKSPESEIVVKLGAYEFLINGRLKVMAFVNRNDGRSHDFEFSVPINKWTLFSMQIKGQKMHWQINNRSFSFSHLNVVSRDKVIIQIDTNETVLFENMLIDKD